MKEYYECSQQNLKQKSDELNEAQNIIDSLHEKMIEIENELLSYKNSSVDHSKFSNLHSIYNKNHVLHIIFNVFNT